ncbi:hypothetical protein ETI11_01925 [Macrococcoides canis]|uniref:HTH-type transcriptional regulator SgrR n=1 Tax=Macrococcoides canis TaxID=1855823 RepID=A0A4R6C756_9STAP|nr:ABC transporter substrate-binding protein [Macrococcus canis]TDM18228.1 hypothetical protein ETI04_01675 [Macrococcus canis]TDM24221.1 hypothetical protein ETI02_00045 [Macrococcus canis]TDM38178.1 hypothetical protein ETI11_01925 [Macrococcus canis]
MEQLLLSFYNLKITAFHQSSVSEQLNVSQKHLSRSLKRWQDSGYLTFKSARGRGNQSKVQWYVDIDTLYFNKVNAMLTPYQLSDAIQYLTWDWSIHHKQMLITKANQLLGVSTIDVDKLVVKKRYAPLYSHPLEVVDINSANILSNIYDTLVTYDKHSDQYHLKIAQHIDFYDDHAVIYLRKNVYFHDGTQVTAEDIKRCLSYAKAYQETKVLLSPIVSMEVINKLTLKIYYNDFSYFKDVLCKLNLAIYKQDKQQIIGTGPFYIAINNEFQTTLKSFNQYYGYQSYLDEVELIYIPKLKESNFMLSDSDTFQHIEVTDGFYYVLSLAQNKLSHLQKATVHYLFQQSVHHLKDIHTTKDTPYILKNQPLSLKPLDKLEDHFSITIVYPSYIEKKMLQYKRYLKQYNIEAVLKPIDIMTSFKSEITIEGDIYIHGMFFSEAESFEYFTLLYQNKTMHYHLSKQFPLLNDYYATYITTDTHEWNELNHAINQSLFESHTLYPIFNITQEVKVPNSIHNARVTTAGFYNFSEVVIKR